MAAICEVKGLGRDKGEAIVLVVKVFSLRQGSHIVFQVVAHVVDRRIVGQVPVAAVLILTASKLVDVIGLFIHRFKLIFLNELRIV